MLCIYYFLDKRKESRIRATRMKLDKFGTRSLYSMAWKLIDFKRKALNAILSERDFPQLSAR